MKFIGYLILVVLGIILATGASAGSPDKSPAEWKEILTIGDTRDALAGATLTLSLMPDRYYQTNGTEINLNGTLKTLFGPVKDAEILLEKNNSTENLLMQNGVSDTHGNFTFIDNLTQGGIYRFRAMYYPGEMNQTIPVTSDILEVKVREMNASPFPTDDTRVEDQTTEERTHRTILLTLTGSPGYEPGDPVSIQGQVSDRNGTGIPYARILLYPLNNQGSQRSGSLTGDTRKDGNVNFTYHLPGPEPASFVMEYPGTEPPALSDTLVLTPSGPGNDPGARVLHDKETIDAFLEENTEAGGENLTVYGWYGKKEGEPSRFSLLECIWYNFGGQLWDQYQNTSEILTNNDGLFACRVTAPQTPGMYLLGVRSLGNTTSRPVYSNVLVLTVTSPETMNETYEGENLPALRIEADPPVLQQNQELEIRVLLTDANGTLLPDVPVSIQRSYDGIDWQDMPESIVTTDVAGSATMSTRADRTGYLYFQAFIKDKEGSILQSNILIIPVTNPQNKIGSFTEGNPI